MMLPVRNFNKLLLTALLVGAVSTASAGIPCGTNLEYTISGTTLVLTSPDPNQSANISTSAFENNTTITDVVIPANVNEIMYHAFYGCSSLVSVRCLPQTAPTLGVDAFTSCAAGLIICVPNLSSYNSASNNWHYYTLISSFLHEADEVEVAERKISYFRTNSWTKIDIYRTLRKAGCFNTLCLPFNVPDIATSPLAGAEVYVFLSAVVVDNALQLNITPLVGSALTAGTPYLIKWENDDDLYNMHFTDITWDSDQTAGNAGAGPVTFNGFYGMTHIGDATSGEQHLNLFLGANNTLYWPSDGGSESAKMLGFRAWFQITPTPSSPAPAYRGMPATLNIVSTPTNMGQVQDVKVQSTKVLRNGQIIIIRNGEQYSITGQKL